MATHNHHNQHHQSHPHHHPNQPHQPNPNHPSQHHQNSASSRLRSQSFKIVTQYGDMLVVRQGSQPASSASGGHDSSPQATPHAGTLGGSNWASSRPTIMTFHDLGLNSELQFAKFCECDEVKLMLQTFTMVHVNFIGQEFSSEGGVATPGDREPSMAPSLPADFRYPNCEQLAECIVDVCGQLRVRSFIGLAVGAGAHVVSLLTLMRPDLVDGLFLINPVASGSSIIEWLHLKISAIASNHHISGGGHASSKGTETPAGDQQDGQTAQNKQHQPQNKSHHSGMRKLLSMGSHLSFHYNSNSNTTSQQQLLQQQPITTTTSTTTTTTTNIDSFRDRKNTDSQKISTSKHMEKCNSNAGDHDDGGVAQPACDKQPQAGGDGGSGGGQPSSRLRWQILSRNFRQHTQLNRQQRMAQLFTLPDTPESPTREPGQRAEDASCLADTPTATDSASGKSAKSGSRASSKRAPIEYLMYHHFGPNAMQRLRRPSDSTTIASGDLNVSSSVAGDCPSDSITAEVGSTGCDSPVSRGSASSRAPATRACAGDNDSSDGSMLSMPGDSPRGSPKVAAGARAQRKRHSSTGSTHGGRLGRSGSINLSASHLASIPSDRARHAYMQSVYRSYFEQLNGHNLWLFAQSFAKRKALNLRKDCGAAAHAAAAAAALGSSISFMRIGGGGTAGPGDELAESNAHCTNQPEQPHQAQHTDQQHRADPGTAADHPAAPDEQAGGRGGVRALVAGTKVKRTFNCQTLVMCSCVQLHCDRAFKLMSLLNPLQATCIKTDNLLVLEEKPDKVCQALRLFLQGLGYSMSSYDRRLKLTSASRAGSNDSAGST